LTPDGRHCGFSNHSNATYCFLTESMDTPCEAQRITVEINQRWQKQHQTSRDDVG
jgi:hypothetical protein